MLLLSGGARLSPGSGTAPDCPSQTNQMGGFNSRASECSGCVPRPLWPYFRFPSYSTARNVHQQRWVVSQATTFFGAQSLCPRIGQRLIYESASSAVPCLAKLWSRGKPIVNAWSDMLRAFLGSEGRPSSLKHCPYTGVRLKSAVAGVYGVRSAAYKIQLLWARAIRSSSCTQ